MKDLYKLIQDSVPHRIVKLLYYCESVNDYSDENMTKWLTNNENLNI